MVRSLDFSKLSYFELAANHNFIKLFLVQLRINMNFEDEKSNNRILCVLK